jgi:hypothetical protein
MTRRGSVRFVRYYLECLSPASYLIGAETDVSDLIGGFRARAA